MKEKSADFAVNCGRFRLRNEVRVMLSRDARYMDRKGAREQEVRSQESISRAEI